MLLTERSKSRLELIAVMELGVIRGAIDPHSVNDFEPTVTESAQSISVTAILLAMILIVTLGPRTTGQTLLSKKTWPAGGVCHKPNVDERDDIFRSVWSPGLFRHSIVDFGHRRPPAGLSTSDSLNSTACRLCTTFAPFAWEACERTSPTPVVATCESRTSQ